MSPIPDACPECEREVHPAAACNDYSSRHMDIVRIAAGCKSATAGRRKVSEMLELVSCVALTFHPGGNGTIGRP